MVYYLSKPSLIQPSKTMYYTGDGKWSDDISETKSYPNKEELEVWIANEDNTNGGFKTATVVEE